ncbi:MAG: hypothetical protein PHC52_13945 [Syntrophales bacterium]|nr:hypothetical protein [Candidatus ainarchaeum sp.]MDD5533892.1 hypothetical protein [Syntrophales bacterium]
MAEGEDIPGIVREVLRIVSDPATDMAEAGMLLGDSLFSSSPACMGALVRWVISCKSTDMGLYNAAMANFMGYLEAGNLLDAGDLEFVRQAAKADGEKTAARTRAKNILEAAEKAADELELEKLSGFLLTPDSSPENHKRKMAIVQDVSFFLAGTAKVDVLVRFMLDEGACRSDVFDAALATYKELDSHGVAMTDAQISMVGAMLAEGEHAIRAHEVFELMLRGSPRAVLENSNVPADEKARILGNAGMFASDSRAIGSLLGFMLDSEILLASRMLTDAAKRCFVSAMGKGAKLEEDHMVKIVGTLVAGPGRRALQAAQRENALWMFHQAVLQELPVPRAKCQGKLMNAAVGMLPEMGNPGYEQQKERKMYGLKGIKLLLGDWYERLRTGRRAEARWHFRPEDLERLGADRKHADPEVRMEAMMVGEILGKLLPMLERGKDERDGRINNAISRYLNPKPLNPRTEEIFRRYVSSTAQVARISPSKKTAGGGSEADDATPISLGEEGRGAEVARILEKIRRRRGVALLPGEERAQREADRARRAKGRGEGNGGG